MNSIQIVNIEKQYGKEVEALKKVSFHVEHAELFGLIGPDGAGKTSLMRILTTLLLPDGGEAKMAGWDIVKDYKQIRKIVGYMPGRFSLYQDLTVLENLHFFATIFGTTIEKNYDLIRDIYVQIEPFKHRRAGKLSGGMKQKLALCCALIHEPVILILDEPTTGVDAVSRREFWDMLKQYKEKGITILVSTPYMDEASLCDRVALIQEGQMLDVNTPEAIVNAFPYPLFAIKSDNIYQLVKDLRVYPGAHSAYPFGEYVHLATKGKKGIENVQSYLSGRKHTNIEIIPTKANIEDCFMDMMSKEVVSTVQ
ncbi:MAG: ABC transporter ATP-binding protein [Bacteroidetes bacterium]|nr:ABC transporter ATP-binding protein [Bacteroidota bacterium]